MCCTLAYNDVCLMRRRMGVRFSLPWLFPHSCNPSSFLLHSFPFPLSVSSYVPLCFCYFSSSLYHPPHGNFSTLLVLFSLIPYSHEKVMKSNFLCFIFFCWRTKVAFHISWDINSLWPQAYLQCPQMEMCWREKIELFHRLAGLLLLRIGHMS